MDRIASSRPLARNLALHALLLLLVMMGIRVFVGEGVYTTDENAYLVQVDVLDQQASWLAPYPTDGLVDQNSFAPLALSTEADAGWAAYSRHPFYISLLRIGAGLSAEHGAVAVSMLGVLVLALSAAALCQRLLGTDPLVGFWLVGFLSPFFFHGQVVWAHAIASALVGVAAWGTFGAQSQRRGLVIAGLALAGAVALRTEAVFVVVGVGAGVLAAAGSLQHRVIRSTALVGAGVAGFVLDRAAEAAVLGSGTIPRSAAVPSDGFVTSRFQALAALFLSPGGEAAGNLARLLAVALLMAAVVISRRSPTDNAVVVLSGFAAILGVVGALAEGSYVGLLPAAPLFMVGLVAARRDVILRPLWIAGAIVTAGVVLTAPADGGGLGWGGRYLLLCLPLFTPLVVAGLEQLRTERTQRVILASAALTALAINVAGVQVLERNHRNSEIVAQQTSETLLAFVDSDELLVGLDLRVGRIAPESAQSVPMLSLDDPADLDAVFVLADDAQLDELVLVDLFDSPDIEVPTDWDVVDQRQERSVRLTRIARADHEATP